MKKISSLCGAAILSVVVASCGGTPDNDARRNTDVATAAPEPVGTAGEEATAAQPEPAGAPDALPGTASPMPIIGGVGALLVGAGVILRRYIGRG
jgi:hypothetical protein